MSSFTQSGTTMYDIINYTDCTLAQHREILRLRNMDDIRKWMVTQDLITEESHLKFVESLRCNMNRLYLAVYHKGVLTGTFNLTKEADGVWERGILASPTTQGSGETAQWEQQIIDSLPKEQFQTLTAKVKHNNARSLRYHQKMGYIETHRDNEHIYFKKEL